MKYTLIALGIFLLGPIVTQPETISSCDLRIIIHDGRGIEGQAIPAQTVGIIVPCMSKADLTQVLQDVLVTQKPEMRDKANQALHHAADVSLALTTKLATRQ